MALAFARDDGREGASRPLFVVLHARGSDAASAIADARARFGDAADLVAPQAARPCNPFQSNLHGAPGYAGFSWYLGEEPERPEPASFGDALCQLDLFAGALGRPFVIAGYGQGAVLAAALALHVPDGLTGVLLHGAALPRIRGWKLPEARLDGVDVCFEEVDADSLDDVAGAFRRRGARVVEAARWR